MMFKTEHMHLCYDEVPVFLSYLTCFCQVFFKGKGERWEHERGCFMISAWNSVGILFWEAPIKMKTCCEVTNLILMCEYISSVVHNRRDTVQKKKSPHGPSLHVAFGQTEFKCFVCLQRKKKNKKSWRVIFQEYQDAWCYAVEVSTYSSLCQVSISTVWKYRKDMLQFYPWKLACITISSCGESWHL